jgi:hypothetical protein
VTAFAGFFVETRALVDQVASGDLQIPQEPRPSPPARRRHRGRHAASFGGCALAMCCVMHAGTNDFEQYVHLSVGIEDDQGRAHMNINRASFAPFFKVNTWPFSTVSPK